MRLCRLRETLIWVSTLCDGNRSSQRSKELLFINFAKSIYLTARRITAQLIVPRSLCIGLWE